MPSWLGDFFGLSSMFQGASGAWNWCMIFVLNLLTKTPDTFSPDAWTYVTDTLYPWFLSIGAFLLNMFCLIGFCRQASNLRDNVTIEMWIELFIKIIVANTLMVNGLSIMQEFFSVSGSLSTEILISDPPAAYNGEVDAGAVIMYVVFGLVYMLIALVCGVIILIEVLSRFINLYILTATAPIALSTWAGGRGIENTAYAWIKSFLTAVFQIVVIAMVLTIGGNIASGLQTDMTSTVLDWFDGANSILWSMIYMVMMAAGVKGADGLLKRAFDLR